MQKFSVGDGGTATGQAKDRVGLTAGTTYFAKYWNDNFFNIFNAVENAGYSLIDDDLEQMTKAMRGKYIATHTYNTSGFASQTVSDIVEGSDGLLYEVQADGTIGDDPVGSATGDWKAYKPEFIARLEKQVTHNMGSDANYTLAEDQNTFGRIIITDSGVILTAARNIIVSNDEKYILFQNDTDQILTIKTAAGTGIAVEAGAKASLLCDGTNIISGADTVSSVLTGLKNKLINGAFPVNQYADVDAAPVIMVGSDYQIDRFESNLVGVTGTIQRLAKSLINGKYVHSVKCIATSTASGQLGLVQKSEVFYNGETKSFGVMVKSNSTDARAIMYDGVSYTASTAHTGGGAYEFLSFPKTIDGSATILWAKASIVSATNTNVSITSGDYIESTLWQLEDGNTASSFEQRYNGLELELAQRYYLRLRAAHANQRFGAGIFATTTAAYIVIMPYVEMRITPTISKSGNLAVLNGGSTISVTSISAAASSGQTFGLTASIASGGTVGNGAILSSNSDTTSYLEFDAEL